MEKYLLLFMIMAHIFDDYYLQGILAKLKQKSWWKENCTEDKYSFYKYDYITALVTHSISWSFMILLPIIIFYGQSVILFVSISFVINAVIHGIVDDLKANRFKINLIQDQTFHLIQILATYCIFISTCIGWNTFIAG